MIYWILAIFFQVLVKTSGVLEQTEFPFGTATTSITPGASYGEKFFRVTCPLKPELSGMSSGIIQSAGINHVDIEFKLDETNKSAYLGVDVNVSRNAIELAQEMAGFPGELACFAHMYNECDLTLKFKSFEQMAGNAIVAEVVPKEILEEFNNVLNGAGIQVLIRKISEKLVEELIVNEQNGTFGPFFSKAMSCFEELTDVQFVVGNLIFKIEVFAPALIQQFNIPLPEIKDEEAIEPSNYPSQYTTSLHEHELNLQTNLYAGLGYICEKCQEYGSTYGYHCEACQYDLHPNCALQQ